MLKLDQPNCQCKKIAHIPTRRAYNSSNPLSPPKTKDQIRKTLPLISIREEGDNDVTERCRSASLVGERRYYPLPYKIINVTVPKTEPWSLKLHYKEIERILSVEEEKKVLVIPEVAKEGKADDVKDVGLSGFAIVKKWFKKNFPLIFKEETNIPKEERILAKALSVSIRDLESALLPLKRLDLLHVKHSAEISEGVECPSCSDWPVVRVGRVGSVYGSCWKVVGKGTGGIVKLFQRKDGKMFAVKEFRGRQQESLKHYASALAKEYCIGAILEHPNIIKTLELIIEEGKFYEVMEYCDTDLFNFIRCASYGMDEIKKTFKQIVDGVSYLHGLGIAHRDLKPENVCLAHGQVKLIDFGLCSVFKLGHSGKTKMSHGLCGSAPYIAPEEWLGKDYDPRKVDVWSLGVILITLIFHAFPWEVATKADINYSAFLRCCKKKIIYPLFDEIQEDCRDLIMKMLNPNSATRALIEDVSSSGWFLQR